MSAAFDTVFALFVLLILGLAVLSVRWAVRRDRAERAARREADLQKEKATPNH